MLSPAFKLSIPSHDVSHPPSWKVGDAGVREIEGGRIGVGDGMRAGCVGIGVVTRVGVVRRVVAMTVGVSGVG